jgi:hypothetical protein
VCDGNSVFNCIACESLHIRIAECNDIIIHDTNFNAGIKMGLSAVIPNFVMPHTKESVLL